MNASASNPFRGKTWACAALVAALTAPACSSEQTPAKVPEATDQFVFAPRVGSTFQHEMKHRDEVAVPSASFHEALEWRILWEVQVEQQDENFLYQRRLVELGLNVNDQPVLQGNEITAQKADITQVMSSEGRPLDVTGTDELTAAIASLAPENQRSAVAQHFSPANLRELLLGRAVDAFADVVNKPTHVGSTWSAGESAGLLQPTSVRVDSALACGGTQCRRLVRSYELDQQQLADVARRRVAHFVAQQNWDPNALKVVDTSIRAEDSFVVEPMSCHFHEALLVEQGRFTLEGPDGRRVEVMLSSQDSSRAVYPPPS
jgi:hypothetical protein